MKKITPNVAEVLVGQWLSQKGYVNKFKAYWGTTVVNGEEVFINRRYFYPASSQNDSFKKFAKLIKKYEELKNPQAEGIVSAWLYFNPNKFDGSGILDDTIAVHLNDTFNGTNGLLKNGESLRVSIVITNPFSSINSIGGYTWKTLSTVNYVNTIANQTALKQEIIDTYSNVWDNYKITTGSEFKKIKNNLVVGDIAAGDPWVSTFARYILFSTDISYTITNVTKGLTNYSIPQYITTENGDEYVGDKTVLGYTYIVTIDIPPFVIGTSTDIVSLILADVNNKTDVKNAFITRNTLLSRYEEPLDTVYDPESGTYYTVDRNVYNLDGLENVYWIKDGTGWAAKYYLKTSILTDTSIPFKDRYNAVLGCLDTGYQEKQTSWWQDFLAAVIFVVSVYLTFVTLGGSSLTGTALLAAVATSVVVGSLVLSLTSAIAAATGNLGLAKATSQLNKSIEPLVFVAQIVMLFTGISNLAKEGAKSIALAESGASVSALAVAEGSAELAAAEMVTETQVASILETRFTESLIEGITQKISSLLTTKFTDISLNHATKMINYVFDLYSNNKLANLREDVNTLQSEYNTLNNQLSEDSKQNDVLQAMSKVMFSPLASDGSIYAQQFDMPYEHSGTPYHIGNICKTSVKALRLSS